jgi:hypothetical protein|uniref:Neprosin domain-containing protein n=1 Tax=Oryza nivara TaxID=4536 RepID=A0A0E0J066_ORYNI
MGNGQKKVQPLYKTFNLLIKMDKDMFPIGLTIFTIATHKKCYQASIFQDDMFYYGGPGGCTN